MPKDQYHTARSCHDADLVKMFSGIGTTDVYTLQNSRKTACMPLQHEPKRRYIGRSFDRRRSRMLMARAARFKLLTANNRQNVRQNYNR